jgi:hypothetical protein
MFNRILAARLAAWAIIFAPAAAWATHPLTSDDTGTQGKGNFQLEVNGEYDHKVKDALTSINSQANATLTYGIIDSVDLVAGIPYLWTSLKSDDRVINSSANGFSDATLDVKWRFYENDGLSFAIKPGLNLPSGDFGEGLGSGKLGYHVYMIGTLEAGSWTFLTNLGYIRNETDADDAEKDIWHVSAAAIYSINEQWKIAGDLVAERNTDKDDGTNPVSAIAGLIYSPTKDIDLDVGVKAGLTSAAPDWAILAGTTFRF